MEEAAELADYLPLAFKTPKEQEYIELLWDAFETNYTLRLTVQNAASGSSIMDRSVFSISLRCNLIPGSTVLQ